MPPELDSALHAIDPLDGDPDGIVSMQQPPPGEQHAGVEGLAGPAHQDHVAGPRRLGRNPPPGPALAGDRPREVRIRVVRVELDPELLAIDQPD